MTTIRRPGIWLVIRYWMGAARSSTSRVPENDRLARIAASGPSWTSICSATFGTAPATFRTRRSGPCRMEDPAWSGPVPSIETSRPASVPRHEMSVICGLITSVPVPAS